MLGLKCSYKSDCFIDECVRASLRPVQAPRADDRPVRLSGGGETRGRKE